MVGFVGVATFVCIAISYVVGVGFRNANTAQPGISPIAPYCV